MKLAAGILGIVLICFTLLAQAQENAARYVMFTTQDRNGLHFLLVRANSRSVVVAATTYSETGESERREWDYPRDVFDRIWNRIAAGELAAFEAEKEKVGLIGQDKHYVLQVASPEPGQALSEVGDLYLVPKCGAAESIHSMMSELAQGFLPEGSPGQFHLCPETTGDKPAIPVSEPEREIDSNT
jgi:hypothetical protein